MTEKLFYIDSHMKNFTARVEACIKDKEKYWVVLDRTAFFPEGGGQYADTGTLDGMEVLDVKEKDGKIFHLLKSPLVLGSSVKGEMRWKERFTKMQQHTGEHIVSGLIHGKFGYNNVGFHLGSEDCTMDFDGEITREELREIEWEANHAVVQNLEVVVSYPSKEELEVLAYRSKIEIAGQVRIVTIPGYDVCACCAPHVKKTGEIGVIKLTNVQRYKGGVRIRMLCGFRALEDYDKKEDYAKEISAELCAKESTIVEAVRHLKEEYAREKMRSADLERKWLAYRAKEIPQEEDAVCVFEEHLGGDALRMLMNLLLEQERICCVVFGGNDTDGYRYVMGSRSIDVRPLAKEMNGYFSGKGGGKPEMVQGTVLGKAEELQAWILEKARNIKP